MARRAGDVFSWPDRSDDGVGKGGGDKEIVSHGPPQLDSRWLQIMQRARIHLSTQTNIQRSSISKQIQPNNVF